jgi:hypothetical protein
MFKLSTPNSVPNCNQPPPPPVIIDEEPEYKISEILNSKLDKRQACKLLYLVGWSGYEGTDEETSWISANELGHAFEIVSEFHLLILKNPVHFLIFNSSDSKSFLMFFKRPRKAFHNF